MRLRKATQADLPMINQVIEAAIMTWALPERVKRLSMPSYFYNEIDLDHFDIIVAEQDSQIVAVAAWEEVNPKDIPAGKTGLFLHGLYVHPGKQHQGIASQLVSAVENAARKRGINGILVKAQTDAIPFFIKMGMQPVAVKNHSRDYAKRFWKPLDT